MRIIDRLCLGPLVEAHCDSSGNRHETLSRIDIGQALAQCHLRYALDRPASQQCAEVMRQQSEIFEVDPSLLRFPTETCWMEFYADDDPADRRAPNPSLRYGLLAETDRSGRRGQLRSFREQGDGTVLASPGTVEFDLDDVRMVDGKSSFRMRNADLPGLDFVQQCSAFIPDASWLQWCTALGERERLHFLGAQVRWMWFILPYALCFSALLNTRSVLTERRSDLGRLNGARARRGRPPLLDHIEVSLRIGTRAAQANGDLVLAGSRRPPRLHIVRGHPVARAGKTFWRATHIRGEGERLPSFRTVNVRPSQ